MVASKLHNKSIVLVLTFFLVVYAAPLPQTSLADIIESKVNVPSSPQAPGHKDAIAFPRFEDGFEENEKDRSSIGEYKSESPRVKKNKNNNWIKLSAEDRPYRKAVVSAESLASHNPAFLSKSSPEI
ncbi:hypothetical protein DFH11DRAFT_1541092 [Phellopilus nigrolimitatus]|nr:hypothetical protein DFH11DRAFT_1541092 [Phellopilus nigrolimitatus]